MPNVTVHAYVWMLGTAHMANVAKPFNLSSDRPRALNLNNVRQVFSCFFFFSAPCLCHIQDQLTLEASSEPPRPRLSGATVRTCSDELRHRIVHQNIRYGILSRSKDGTAAVPEWRAATTCCVLDLCMPDPPPSLLPSPSPSPSASASRVSSHPKAREMLRCPSA